jgi:hypothetical protein
MKRQKRFNPFRVKRALNAVITKSMEAKEKDGNSMPIKSVVYLPSSVIQLSLEKYRASRSDLRKNEVENRPADDESGSKLSFRKNIDACCKIS